MIKSTIYRTAIRFAAAAIAVAAAAACSDKHTLPGNGKDGGTFAIIAEVAEQIHSRANGEDVYVMEGIYHLTYPTTSTSAPYGIASVDFAKEGSEPGIGIVTAPGNKALKWNDIGGGSTPTFYLDNVDPALANAAESTPQRVVFGAENPYRAALFAGNRGSNDLLWGERMSSRNASIINFDLHHNMSLIRVQVTVDTTNEANPGDLSLEGATVDISSLNQVPVAYNRTDGTLELDETEPDSYTTLKLVDPDPATKIDWKQHDTDEENANVHIYLTEDFVLPPQGLLEDENRPRLTITLANGRVYSGILPTAMFIEDETHPGEPSYPVALYFLKEHILTIRTIITEEPPRLDFMPVWVVEWVDKGSFDIDAHQAGIYTEAEFYKLIQYYNDGNEYQLSRYGNLTTDSNGNEKWLFQFFHGVELDYSRIYNQMRERNDDTHKPFEFTFNNYGVYVQKGDNESVQLDPQRLHDIVTGSLQL